jgi:hypothetical protein
MTDISLDINGKIRASDLRILAKHGPIKKLSLTDMPLLTARTAQGLRSLPSVEHLWLWCDVTRTAMRHVVSIPGLRVLDTLNIVKPGRLEGFSEALSLEIIRANHGLSAEDMLEISTCRTLCEIGAQDAELSPELISALLAMPRLNAIDLEASRFDDAMAEQLSASTSITSLDVGATNLSHIGLAYLCKMQQLRSLDIWAAPVRECDLDLLAALPKLEYLSIGGYGDARPLDAESILPTLSAMPSLKRLWLDGIELTPSQREALDERYENVRIT